MTSGGMWREHKRDIYLERRGRLLEGVIEWKRKLKWRWRGDSHCGGQVWGELWVQPCHSLQGVRAWHFHTFRKVALWPPGPGHVGKESLRDRMMFPEALSLEEKSSVGWLTAMAEGYSHNSESSQRNVPPGHLFASQMFLALVFLRVDILFTVASVAVLY